MMVGSLLFAMLIAPAVAALGILVFRQPAIAERLNLIASMIVFATAVPLSILSANGPYYFWANYIVVDMPGAWVTLCTAIVYLLASIYAIGYMRLLENQHEQLWSFYALFAGFALTVLVSTVMNNAGLYWIAIELTTLVSTFLVGFERAAESVEAAWKYIIIVSAGISLALLGTVLFYWCGSFVLGPVYDMTWMTLQQSASRMNPTLVSLAYLLVLIGYGTKVGLAPMHTWLPDAHSESPAPVSAMLSGALLNGAMLGIVRYLAVADSGGSWIFRPHRTCRPRRSLVVNRRTVHCSPRRHKKADGLFQRRAHGRGGDWIWLRWAIWCRRLHSITCSIIH